MRTKVMAIMLLAACQFMLAACFHEDMPPAPVERVQVGDSLPAMELLMTMFTTRIWQNMQKHWCRLEKILTCRFIPTATIVFVEAIHASISSVA